MNYIGVIHKDPDSDFGVSFPDFPGCITAGRTLAEAKVMAEEALNVCIEEMYKAGEALPVPSSLAAVLADPDFADGEAFLVVAGRVASTKVVSHKNANPDLERVMRERERIAKQLVAIAQERAKAELELQQLKAVEAYMRNRGSMRSNRAGQTRARRGGAKSVQRPRRARESP